MGQIKKLLLLTCIVFSPACVTYAEDNLTVTDQTKSEQINADPTVLTTPPDSGGNQKYNYELLRKKITYGNATLAEVRQALTEEDTASLTNTLHALYSMRWHRGVFKLLYAMWEDKQETYQELNWEAIGKPPVKIALASTLNRIQISDTAIFQDYIRSFKDHEHEFIRAQVVVALGFNGDPDDIDYLKSMVDGDNRYVTQTAITGLALMGGNQARDAMIALWKTHKNNPRGTLLLDLLFKAYSWTPPTEKHG